MKNNNAPETSHPDRERARRWRAANPEHCRRRQKEWRTRNPEKARANQIKYKYGITLEQFNEMLAAQGHCCGACSSPDPNHKFGWVVDHCHATNKVRGILCSGCNTALGQAKEDPFRLRAIADYAERQRSNLGP